MQTRPTMLHSCAWAATAAEASFRIDVPIAPARATRVVALDSRASTVVRNVADRPWETAWFFTLDSAPGRAAVQAADPDSLQLQTISGSGVLLGEALTGVDVVVMVAANDDGALAAESIGTACSTRGIMTAGLALSYGSRVAGALSALRPHARVLMVPAEEDDLVQLLVALRA